MHDMVLGYWAHFNDPLEGTVPFMYLDIKGWVSTGVGNKIDETERANSAATAAEREASLRLANQINWYNKNNGAPASPADVAVDWDNVKARLDLAPLGHRAFENLTQLRISSDEILGLVQRKVLEMERVLTSRAEFRDFADWPANAQLATLSMSWGMGPMFRFPTFQNLVANGRWAEAAEECRFNPDEGTIKIRNKLNRVHLYLAQAVADQNLAIERLAIRLDEVLGVQHALWMLGYNPGPQDGGDGPRTQGAVSSFQSVAGVGVNGAWHDPETQAFLAATLTDAGWTVV